jgi:hypothetical protein
LLIAGNSALGSGKTRVKSSALLGSILFALAGLAANAESPLTDTQLRAAFCFGALDQGIQLFRAVTTPWASPTIADFTEKRERLRRFLLPFPTDPGNGARLNIAIAEGRRSYQDCNSVIVNTPDADVCKRVRQCFDLNWLPY